MRRKSPPRLAASKITKSASIQNTAKRPTSQCKDGQSIEPLRREPMAKNAKLLDFHQLHVTCKIKQHHLCQIGRTLEPGDVKRRGGRAGGGGRGQPEWGYTSHRPLREQIGET